MNVSKVTIKDVSTEWLNMKRLTVKQSTYSRYYHVVKTEILPELGKIALNDLNSSTVNAFTSRKLNGSEENERKPLASKTVRDICTILKSIIKYGENEYRTGPLAENTVLPKNRRESIETLNEKELRRFTEYLWKHQEKVRYAGLLLCLYSGMRIGEICALRWEDIDLEERVIHVTHTIQRIIVPDETSIKRTQIIMDEPKTMSSLRIIPMSNQIYPMMKNLYSTAEDSSFFLTNSEKFIEPRNYQYFFKRVLKKAEVRNVNFHILRHTFATRCVEVGMDVKTLSEILGHSNTNITLTYYVHSSLETKKRQIDMLKF